MQLKETGEVPQGPILVAGSGPLPLLERSRPFRAMLEQPGAAFNGLRSWPQLVEALGYACQLFHSGVPYRTGCRVTAIEAMPQGLRVAVVNRHGQARVYEVAHLALHDGLDANQTGLPRQEGRGLPVVWAGDCREVLGCGGSHQ